MKTKIITVALLATTLITTATAAFYIGRSKAEINTIERKVYIVPENYVNMHDVIGYESTDTGIMLHFDDGTGYYLEK